MLQKILLLYVTPAVATATTVAVVSFNAMRKKKVNPELTDEELQVQWGNGAPDPVSYTHLTLPTTPYV